jgi:hypothetical protein
MAKKKTKKCKCMKHNKKCNPCIGKYYSQGELDETEAKLIKKLAEQGATIYRQYGVPPATCGLPGLPKCNN